MRIGIDLSPLQHSAHRGIGMYARSLLKALGQIAPQHQYVLFIPTGTPDGNDPPGHTTIQIPNPRLGLASALATGQVVLPWLAWKARLDVLHSLDVPFNPSHTAPPLASPCPLVVTLHDLTPLYSPRVQGTFRYKVFYKLALWLAGRAAALVVDSEASKKDAMRMGVARRRRVFVAPLAGTSLDSTDTTPDTFVKQPRNPYLLHVGSNDWNKNREGLLRAFSMLDPAYDVSLALVGGGEEWRDFLDESRQARVVHYPWVEQTALQNLYRDAAAFVFPSRYEGFGLPILEAMQAGAPVITSDRGAMKEVAGDAALLIDPEAAEQIAQAIVQVLKRPELAADLREKGAEQAARFSWERTARATLEAYEAAARRRRNKRR
jgi:glycosyltransferase involved in cell wall biosynthesis